MGFLEKKKNKGNSRGRGSGSVCQAAAGPDPVGPRLFGFGNGEVGDLGESNSGAEVGVKV